jgi:hypothetical protein
LISLARKIFNKMLFELKPRMVSANRNLSHR